MTMLIWVKVCKQLGHCHPGPLTPNYNLILARDDFHGVIDTEMGRFQRSSAKPDGGTIAPLRNFARPCDNLRHNNLHATT